MELEVMLIDLDGTLYDRSTGLAAHQADRCRSFFRDRLGCDDEEQMRRLGSLTLDGVREAPMRCSRRVLL